MNEQKSGYDLPHCYLEVARAVTRVEFRNPLGREAFLRAHGAGPPANAVFAVMSASVIYSYLAVEAFVNGQLYLAWRARDDGSEASERFRELLGKPGEFEALRHHRRFRELPRRANTLCHVFGIRKPHEAIPGPWHDFNDLVKESRHFLAHPTPTPERFRDHVNSIMEETEAGRYSEAAQEVIRHFYVQMRKPEPPWLRQNTLIRLDGVTILAKGEGS